MGLLLWASMNTRPDLAFSVNQLGAKCAHPDVDDWKRLMYCLRYIKKDMDFKLEYKREDSTTSQKILLLNVSQMPHLPQIWTESQSPGQAFCKWESSCMGNKETKNNHT